MPEIRNLMGMRFGRLVVIGKGEDSFTPKGRRIVKWTCKCECGNVKDIATSHLVNGDNVSCGCFHKERSSESAKRTCTKHSMSKTRIYKEYIRMKSRCNSEKNPSYQNYGGRGIKVCEEWNVKDGFESFFKWAVANGYDDKLTLDRIDVEGDYGPDNCRWADWETQYNNTTKSVKLTYMGKTQTAAQWGREIGLDRHTIYGRLKKGLPIEEVLDPKHRVGGRWKHQKPTSIV